MAVFLQFQLLIFVNFCSWAYFVVALNSFNAFDSTGNCSQLNCLNGGFCRPEPLGIEACECSNGFTGKYCEKIEEKSAESDCTTNSCHENSEKTAAPKSRKMSQKICSESMPCENKGSCNHVDGTCHCTDTFQGDLCEIPRQLEHSKNSISFCSSKFSCLNGATCMQGPQSHVCLCPAGFTGSRCEFDVKNSCVNSPCGPNSISCRKALDGYYCLCKPNFTGKRCEIKRKMLCQNSDQCPKNSKCIFISAASFCQCLEGFAGQNCEQSTTATFFGESTLVHVTHSDFYSHLNTLNFDFRTVPLHDNTEATIVSQDSLVGKVYSVRLMNHMIFIELNSNTTMLSFEQRVTTGQWFTVRLVIDYSEKSFFASLSFYDHGMPLFSKSGSVNISWTGRQEILLTQFGGRGVNRAPHNFIGCLRDMQINEKIVYPQFYANSSVNVGYECPSPCNAEFCSKQGHCLDALVKKNCRCFRPYTGARCDISIMEGTLGHENNATFIQVAMTPEERGFFKESGVISGYFKTRQNSGVLLHFPVNLELSIETFDGRLQIRLKHFEIQNDTVIHNKTAKRVNDGKEHFLEFKKFEQIIQLLLDNTTILSYDGVPGIAWDSIEDFFIGGVPENYFSMDKKILEYENLLPNVTKTSNFYFKGTLRDWRVGSDRLINILFQKFEKSDLVNFGEIFIHGPLLNGTVSDSMCFSDEQPCLNGGQCHVTFNHYYCTCNSGWHGKNCDAEKMCATKICSSKTARCHDLEPRGFVCLPQVAFPSHDSYSRVNFVSPKNSGLVYVKKIKFELMTSSNLNGVIFTFYRENGESFFILELLNGFLAYSSENKKKVFAKVSSSPVLTYAEVWYNISLDFGSSEISTLRDFTEIHIENMTSFPLRNSSRLTVGWDNSAQHQRTGFVGCLRNFQMIIVPEGTESDDLEPPAQVTAYVPMKPIEESQDFFSNFYIENIGNSGLLDGCQGGNLCHIGDVCNNSAKCIQKSNFFDFECQCTVGFTGQRCEKNIDDCIKNACSNGAICIDGISSYTCQCKNGFNGTFCEFEANECESSPCENNGKCVDLLADYKCICDKDFTGKNCESMIIPACSADPCKNGGKCTEHANGINQFLICECFPPFYGQFCELKTVHCENFHCLNGGTCDENGNLGNVTCSCMPGYKGNICEVKVNDCISHNPCLHGQCFDGTHGFTCHCYRGWAGKICDEDLNECEISPCLNNGICENSMGSFTCHCSEFYFGELCEIHGSCLSHPCFQGKCHQISQAEHSCECDPGYMGSFCNLTADPCLSNPCRNNGVCESHGEHTFSCHCLDGFFGNVCDEVQMNNCLNRLCLNNGKCTVGINGSECDCEGTGFIGPLCQEDLDECQNPINCVHGICLNFDGGFNCSCLQDFFGPKCDIRDPCKFNSSNACESQKLSFSIKTGRLALYFGIPSAILVVLGLGAACTLLLMTVKKNRATKGTYSPSRQEMTGVRLRFGPMMKPPLEERLI